MFNDIARIASKLNGVNSQVVNLIGPELATVIADPKNAVGMLSTAVAEMLRVHGSQTAPLASQISKAFGDTFTQTTSPGSTQGAGAQMLLEHVVHSQQLRKMSLMAEILQIKLRLMQLEAELDRLALNPNMFAADVPMSMQDLLDQLKSPLPPAPPTFAKETAIVEQSIHQLRQLQDLLTRVLEAQSEAARQTISNIR